MVESEFAWCQSLAPRNGICETVENARIRHASPRIVSRPNMQALPTDDEGDFVQRPRRRRPALGAPAVSLAIALAGAPCAPSATATWVSTAFSADQTLGSQVYVEDLPITVYESSTRVLGTQTSGSIRASTERTDVHRTCGSHRPGTCSRTYADVRQMFASPDHVRLSLHGQVDCGGTSPATVHVAELEWTGTTLTTLDLTITCPHPTAPLVAELRLNSDRPITARGVSDDQIFFPRTLAGTAASPKTLTVTGHGTTPLEISSISISGTDISDSADFDTCTHATLHAAETRAIAIGYAPDDGPAIDRVAWLTIRDNTMNGFRGVQLGGAVKRPTTITLTSANNPATLPDRPVSIMPTLYPLPPEGHGTIKYFVNGVWTRSTSPTTSTPYQGTCPGRTRSGRHSTARRTTQHPQARRSRRWCDRAHRSRSMLIKRPQAHPECTTSTCR